MLRVEALVSVRRDVKMAPKCLCRIPVKNKYIHTHILKRRSCGHCGKKIGPGDQDERRLKEEGTRGDEKEKSGEGWSDRGGGCLHLIISGQYS